MKLKSLKITLVLFLVLSLQPLYAGDDIFTPANCSGSELTGPQQKICDTWEDETNTYNKGLASGTYNQKQYDDLNQIKMQKFTTSVARMNRDAAKTANDVDAATKGMSNDDKLYCAGNKAEPASAKTVAPYGSSGMSNCDRLSLGNMRSIYEGNGGRKSIPWQEFIRYSCKDKCNQGTAFNECVTKSKTLARKCESIAYVINSYGRSWTNEEQVAEVSGNGSSGAIGAKTTQSANGAAASVAIGAASPIKCVSKGIETVDYDACKKFQVQLDLMDGIQQVGYGAQELIYKDKMIDSQAKYATEQNTATGALKAQGESLKDQESMYQQRTAVDAVKLGYLYSIYNELPRAEDVKKKCSGVSSIQDTSIGEVKETECKEAVTAGQGGFAITMNQQQIEAMRSRLIGIATSAGANLLLANLLGKRADDVDNAIAKIDAFKPADPFTTSEADAQTTFCRMNPGVASCLTGDLERTFDTMNDNVITFGDGATGTSYGTNTNADGSVISSGLADSSTRTAVGPVGSIIAAAAQDNSIEKSDAAKVNSSGSGSTGGGGSGGGGSAGGGGGGGGAPTAGGAAGQAAAIAARAPGYNGGTSFSVMGGFGINKKKADGKVEDNPFGKLFGKDGAKGGDVNFRDIASQKVGGKGDNLFDMISKRYSSVNADKRLLEYELKK